MPNNFSHKIVNALTKMPAKTVFGKRKCSGNHRIGSDLIKKIKPTRYSKLNFFWQDTGSHTGEMQHKLTRHGGGDWQSNVLCFCSFWSLLVSPLTFYFTFSACCLSTEKTKSLCITKFP